MKKMDVAWFKSVGYKSDADYRSKPLFLQQQKVY